LGACWLSKEESEGKLQPVGRFFVSALTIAFFAITVPQQIAALLSLDIAKTFFPTNFLVGSSPDLQASAIGAVTQIVTVNSFFEVIFALIMGVVAVRLSHKPLLLGGVVMIIVSAVGSYLSPTLWILGVFFAVEGAGTVIVAIMGMTLVGEFLPFNRKSKTVSYLVAATAAAAVFSAPIISLITSFGGWRLNFLLFAMPLSVFGLLLTFYALPKTQRTPKAVPTENVYLKSLKRVLLNRSAAFCLLGGALGSSATVGTFALAYYRQQLGLPLDFAAIVLVVASLMYVAASLVIGRFVNRVGARILALVTALINGVFIIIFFFMPTWWIAFPLDMIHVWFGAAVFTAFSCLALDQVPTYRATMMSMRSVFASVGGAIGAALAGAMLIIFGSYQAVGISFGIMSVASAGAFLLTRDPTKRPSTDDKCTR
jgi:predicted MFS family arabinose efflux permease